jgi:hypothetical protein
VLALPPFAEELFDVEVEAVPVPLAFAPPLDVVEAVEP